MSLDGHAGLVCCVRACVCVCIGRLQTSGQTVSPSSSSHLLLLHLFPLSFSSRPPPEQARRELRRLKEEARRKHAVAVIWAYWQGLKVPTSPTAQLTTKSATYPAPTPDPVPPRPPPTIFALLLRKPVSAHCCDLTLFIIPTLMCVMYSMYCSYVITLLVYMLNQLSSSKL